MLVVTLVVVLALGAVEFFSSEEGAVGSIKSRAGSPSEATADLEELEVAAPGSMSGYSRENATGARLATSAGTLPRPPATHEKPPWSATGRTSR